jgi:Ca2+-binding EF-hand superfamily protein
VFWGAAQAIKCAALAEDDGFDEVPPNGPSSPPSPSSPPDDAKQDAAAAAASAALAAAAVALKPDSPQVAQWKAAFTASAAAAGATELGEPAFLALVRAEMVADEGAHQPTADDLRGAFALADADGSGKVDQAEFVRLMQLVASGDVKGLASAGFFQKAGREAKFKNELAAAQAKDAKLALAAAAAEAASLAQQAKVAAVKVAEARRLSQAPVPFTEVEKADAKWRAMFNAALKEGQVDLQQPEFVLLVKKAMVKEVMSAASAGEGGAKVAMPLDKDLAAAFAVADVDQSGEELPRGGL